MTAYWISSYSEILDADKMAAYAKLALPALTAAGGTFLARGVAEAWWEQGIEERVVLIEFDSVEAAVAAHDSPAYAEALAALDGGAVRDIRIVPGA
ncbi:DUF1330 domain-containing protein [Nocardioides sp. zg-536]|uniref:DUF1330 domain-containing protein n=1 Tax=Nocardioides faecalis TaxID=2803858 RepID=A0A939BT52_9ACTN|nr:DUF1330 domain-containing protein [Nocardioides faecalis]MBM9460299.1 DUF1330 domain-containing protein [Nocardioides faecalis]MBS4751224.1 DUF1330 domain-containing protein [Nocardioides faecalis]QVI59867.1 DUF1330 domain-containing protein [Nocardioides faecalis]